MRRKASGSVLGPALLGIGILMMALGFFGGSLGVPGLSVVQSYWGPENATLYVYHAGSVNEPNFVVMHYWYGYSDTEPGVYHVIDGSQVKVYIDGAYYTTITTNKDRAIFYTPVSTLTPGTHEVKFVYDGTPGLPYPPDEYSVHVTVSGGSVDTDASAEPLGHSVVGDFLKIAGASLGAVGSALMVLNARGRR